MSLLSITNTMLMVFLFISCLLYARYLYLIAKYDDAFYFRISLRYVLIMAFVAGNKMILTRPNLLEIAFIFAIFNMLFLAFTFLFGEKFLEKSDEKHEAIYLLEQCGIKYSEFKKLSREEQLTILNSAVISWADGTTDKLVEDEDDLKDFHCILH